MLRSYHSVLGVSLFETDMNNPNGQKRKDSLSILLGIFSVLQYGLLLELWIYFLVLDFLALFLNLSITNHQLSILLFQAIMIVRVIAI
jgi:hypothetical protein